MDSPLHADIHRGDAMNHTMIVSSSNRVRNTGDAIWVGSPLEAIVRLESPQRIDTVVLAGSYATNHELAAALVELYPTLRVECEVLPCG
jgi:hypothetical protein